MKSLVAKAIRQYAKQKFALLNFLRILYLRLKYPGLSIDLKTKIEGGCKIVCVDGGKIEIRNSFISYGTHIFSNVNAVIKINGAFIGRNCIIVSRKLIEIEDGCAIAEMVVVRDQNHQVDFTNLEATQYNFDSEEVRIGKHVWIGAKATILKGVTILEKSVIAAAAVVVKPVPAGEIWGGIPARYIKKYDYHSDGTFN